MSELTIPSEVILNWNDISATQWMRFLTAHPAILDLPCDVRDSGTVARTFQHIYAVELRFAQRLAALPESPYEDVAFDSPQQLLATHNQAIQLIRGCLADPAYDWNTEIEFHTITAGQLRATRQAVFLHALLHSIRHYAQLATLVRQHGYKPDWAMDYLYTSFASKPA